MTEENNEPGLDAQIEQNLRRVYQQKLEEDIPDELMQLLSQLKAQDEGQSNAR